MKASIITSIAALVALTSAAPAASYWHEEPSYSASETIFITLMGATPEAQYTVSMPADSAFRPTYNSLSISHASTTGGPCGLFGIDGLLLEIDSAKYVDVGPPQTIVAIVCGPKKGYEGW